MYLPLSSSIASLNAVAMGKKDATIILKNGMLVNIYTREISQTEIAIYKDRIAYVGPDASHTCGKKTIVYDLEQKFITPGFADPHIHIDHFISPAELAKKSLLCGVTSLFSDPIDIVSVGGYKGLQEFVKNTSNLPIRFFHVVPGGLPVDRKFSHGRFLTESQEKSAVKIPDILGLGEVFSWTKVTQRDAKTMKTISHMLDDGCIINGHTAGATDKKLNAYVSSGIISCHEPINFDQVLERLRLGMWIMIREGSIRRDIDQIVPYLLGNNTYVDRLMFCSDGVDPIDIQKYGHIDHCIRKSVMLGMNLIDAFRMATKNCFDYYNMGKDLGGIAPGKLADILIFDDLLTLKPTKVFVGGKLLVDDGKIITKIKTPIVPQWLKNTVRKRKFLPSDFVVKSKSSTADVNVINMSTEIITELQTDSLPVHDQNVVASLDKDIWKVAAFDRIFGTSKHTVGFLKTFGADIGAFASTWSFHENDLIIIGSNESDMAIAANTLVKSNGGMTVIKNGKVLSLMPLQMGGIISTDPFDKVRDNFVKLNSSLVDNGCKFDKPHLMPLFLPFLALPNVRILHGGIVDVKNRSYVSPIIE